MIVYTDGSTSNNGRADAAGGIGVWFGENDERNVSDPYDRDDRPTNQRCELYAILKALKTVAGNKIKSLTVRTDSRYCIGCLTTWYKKWRTNDWKNSKNKPVENQQLIRDILDEIESAPYAVRFEHVVAHADSVGNNAADSLANIGRLRHGESR